MRFWERLFVVKKLWCNLSAALPKHGAHQSGRTRPRRRFFFLSSIGMVMSQTENSNVQLHAFVSPSL